jgi:HEAT repeat protein
MADLTTCSPEQFLETLHHQTLEGRRALVLELGRHPSERSVEILVEILQGDSWYLRDLAVRAVSQIGDPAVPRLVGLLESGLWYTRAAAARALGRIGFSEGLPFLVLLLSDRNHTVQGASLASIADLVRAGQARETARLFWNQGARRAEELKRLLLAVHPDAGGAVAELLADPSSFLREENAVEEEPEEELVQDRKNA